MLKVKTNLFYATKARISKIFFSHLRRRTSRLTNQFMISCCSVLFVSHFLSSRCSFVMWWNEADRVSRLKKDRWQLLINTRLLLCCSLSLQQYKSCTIYLSLQKMKSSDSSCCFWNAKHIQITLRTHTSMVRDLKPTNKKICLCRPHLRLPET